jgi:hypothetical protein
MPSGNPVLRDKAFQGLPVTGERMTLNGTVTRTALLLVLAVITGGWMRIPPMSATHSTPCRPGIPPHAGHLFRRMSARV